MTDLQNAIELGGENLIILGDIGCVYALMGRREDARGVVRQLESTFHRPHTAATSIAHIYFHLDDLDSAYQWLDAAFEVRDSMTPWMCGDPRWEGLWTHPQTRKLRGSMVNR